MVERFNPGDALQKLKQSAFDDLQAGRIQPTLSPEVDVDAHSLFMNELKTLTGSQLREMAAAPDKQALALGAKVIVHETPSKCVDAVLFFGSGQVKIADHPSNGVTLGVALDQRNELSAKCD
ncbi:MAG: hypothetical protein P4L53_01115 [Candidatus Obscuribacterales bacterium]|nr:hypothetical protein [Candidatus Obscuribacterales bacterium]